MSFEKQLFHSKNPASQEIVWEGTAHSSREIHLAIDRARQAAEDFGRSSFEERMAYLKRYAAIIENGRQRLTEAISCEVGKPLWESRSEVQAMIDKVAISIEAYRDRCPERELAQKAGRLITRHRPHGIAVVLGPFNFPGHLPNGHIVPALLAGNAVIFKPSEKTPLVGEIIVEFLTAAGFPRGLVQLIQGGADVAKELACHKEINALFFTGSWSVGQQLAHQFGPYPEKLLVLEMGGNNPLIVWDGKDLKAIAYLIIQSAFLSSGQRCTNARRLIVPDSSFCNRLLDELKKMIDNLIIGPYQAVPEPFMGPLISPEAVEHVLSAEQRLTALGGRLLLKLQRREVCFLTPGLIDVTAVSSLPDEEIFGPFLQIIRVDTFDEAISIANQTEFGLAAGLVSDQATLWKRFFLEIRAGVINWNTPLTGASSHAPFGGVGHSGNHRPSAYYAADYCSHPIASFEKSTVTYPQTLLPGIIQ